MRIAALIFIFLALGCPGIANAQNKGGTDALLQRADELIYNEPEKAIKIGEHLLKSYSSGNKKSDISLLIAQSYLSKGDYSHALNFAFRAENYAPESDGKEQRLKALVLKSDILHALQLDRQAKQYLEKAAALGSDLVSKNSRIWIQGWLLQNEATVNIADKNPEKVLKLFQRAAADYIKLPASEADSLVNNAAVEKAKAYSGLSKPDSAVYVLDRALLFYRREQSKNLFKQSEILNELSKIYFQQKLHLRAIDTLFSALAAAKKIKNLPQLKEINRQLAVNFLAVNDRVNYNRYNREFMELNYQVDRLETESINSAFNLISTEQELQAAAEEKKYGKAFYATVALFLVFFASAILILFRNRSREKRLIEVAAYLEMSKKLSVPPLKKEPAKNLVIPAETEQLLLSKLTKFEATTAFTNKEMSLGLLSSQLETNTKYLSEIINRHYHDNFNTYINKLRISYIIDKMKTNPTYLNYKISYLAEESGFSSHSSFATVFKSITGIVPTTFIEFQKEALKNKES